MPFAPEIADNADLTEVRSKLTEAADYAIGLQRVPVDKRDDAWRADVRSAVDFLQTFDNVEKVKAAEMRQLAEAADEQRRKEQEEERRKRGISGPTAAFEALEEERVTPGREVTSLEGYEEFAQRGGTGMFEAEVRTLLLSENSDPAAGIWRPVGTPVLRAGTERRQRLFVRDLLSVQPTGLSSVPYIRELNAATNETGAAMTSEGSAKAEVVMQFVQADAPIRKITAWIPATTEILADAPTLRGYIDARLAYMILLKEEQQVLAGNGTPPQIRGITETTGTQTQSAVAGDVPATFAAAFGKIENVDGEPDGVAMNPLDFWGAIGTRHSAQFDNGFGGNQPAQVELGSLTWGERVVRTRSLAEGAAIAGSWFLGATLFTREGVTIRVGDQHSDYFTTNKVAILAEERVGLAVHRPDFFVETTIDLTA
jgi:HK97 family phage major capsid protein